MHSKCILRSFPATEGSVFALGWSSGENIQQVDMECDQRMPVSS